MNHYLIKNSSIIAIIQMPYCLTGVLGLFFRLRKPTSLVLCSMLPKFLFSYIDGPLRNSVILVILGHALQTFDLAVKQQFYYKFNLHK